MYYHCLLLVSLLSHACLLNLNHNLGRNKPVHVLLTLVNKESGCDTSGENKVRTHPGPLGFVGTPAFNISSSSLYFRKSLHLKQTHGRWDNVEWFWEWRFHKLLLQAIHTPSSILPVNGCFLIHGILFCWNLSLYPVILMLIHLRITLSPPKHCLFSPLWCQGSAITHFVSEWLISSVQTKYG